MRNVRSGLPITPTQEASVHVGSPIGISGKFYLDWSSEHFMHKHFHDHLLDLQWAVPRLLVSFLLFAVYGTKLHHCWASQPARTDNQLQLLSTTIVFVQVLSPSQKCQLYLTVSVQLPAVLH